MKQFRSGIFVVGMASALVACVGASAPGEAEGFEVLTFERDPSQGGDGALIEGTLMMTGDGWAAIESTDGAVGLILPNVWGTTAEGYTSSTAILSEFPDSFGIMAEDDLLVSYAGGCSDLGGEFGTQWERLCPNSDVAQLFLSQDDNTRE